MPPFETGLPKDLPERIAAIQRETADLREGLLDEERRQGARRERTRTAEEIIPKLEVDLTELKQMLAVANAALSQGLDTKRRQEELGDLLEQIRTTEGRLLKAQFDLIRHRVLSMESAAFILKPEEGNRLNGTFEIAGKQYSLELIYTPKGTRFPDGEVVESDRYSVRIYEQKGIAGGTLTAEESEILWKRLHRE